MNKFFEQGIRKEADWLRNTARKASKNLRSSLRSGDSGLSDWLTAPHYFADRFRRVLPRFIRLREHMLDSARSAAMSNLGEGYGFGKLSEGDTLRHLADMSMDSAKRNFSKVNPFYLPRRSLLDGELPSTKIPEWREDFTFGKPRNPSKYSTIYGIRDLHNASMQQKAAIKAYKQAESPKVIKRTGEGYW